MVELLTRRPKTCPLFALTTTQVLSKYASAMAKFGNIFLHGESFPIAFSCASASSIFPSVWFARDNVQVLTHIVSGSQGASSLLSGKPHRWRTWRRLGWADCHCQLSSALVWLSSALASIR